MPGDEIFFLEKMVPKPEKIFSSSFPAAADIFDRAIIVFDTNALLAPFDVSKESLTTTARVLRDVKRSGRLRIPARVAREFGKNRAKKIADLYGRLKQIQEGLNTSSFNLSNYPLLEGIPEYKAVLAQYKDIRSAIELAKKQLKALAEKLRNWEGDDKVSKAYRQIFTKRVIVECKMAPSDLQTELALRTKMKIPPGYKDSAKADEGIGDLIIWQTMIEISETEKKDIVFVTNEEKADWFHRANGEALFLRFELLHEFNNKTNGQNIGAMNLIEFLKQSKVGKVEVEKIEKEINADIDDWFKPMSPPKFITDEPVYYPTGSGSNLIDFRPNASYFQMPPSGSDPSALFGSGSQYLKNLPLTRAKMMDLLRKDESESGQAKE